MKMHTSTIDLVEKEVIDQLRFPAGEILRDEEIKKFRLQALQRAHTLGNLDKQKVILEFSDSEGEKSVYTTVWAVIEAKVLLKAGRSIPIERISKVKFIEP